MKKSTKPKAPEKGVELEVTLRFKPQRGLGGGFRINHLEASGENFTAGIDSGAGMGNPLVTFYIERKGGERAYFDVDMRDVLSSLIGLATPAVIAQARRESDASITRHREVA